MKKKRTVGGKITKPSAFGVLSRKRLYKLLDCGRDKAIVWLCGPAGSGKTTLLSSYIEDRGLPSVWYRTDKGDSNAAEFFHYMGLAGKMAAPRKRNPLPHLTTEYLQDLPAFTRRFFRDLFGRLKPPFVLVLDNYQEVPRDAPVHDLIVGAVDVLPVGGAIIITSRGDPPPELARLRAKGNMELIAPSELSLTPNESKAIIKMRGPLDGKALTEDEVLNVHEKIGGWVGGLVLILEGAARGGITAASLENLSNDAVFDYFAGEIFNKISLESRYFLMKTSFLPEMTTHMAAAITGLGRSARILSFLSRNHYFIEKHLKPRPLYRYHPLFSEFLQTRAREAFTPERINILRQSAAALLEKEGFIEEAASMYCEAKDWESLGRVIHTYAATLILQGRSMALIQWMKCFPETYLKQAPWLRYWFGAACAPLEPVKARPHFENAFKIFNSRKDASGIFLSWAGATKAIFYEFEDFGQFDRWIKILGGLMREYPAFPSDEIKDQVSSSIFIALTFRDPRHRGMKRWAEAALAIAEHSKDINLRTETGFTLAHYYRWKGEGARCRVIIDSLKSRGGLHKTAPIPRLTSMVIAAAFYWESGDHEACGQVVSEGLDFARESGTSFLNHMLLGQASASALAIEDLGQASGYIKRMSSVLDNGTRFDRSLYHFLLAWEALIKGDLSLARRRARTSLDLIVGLRCPPAEAICRAMLCMTLHEMDEDKEAGKELIKMCALAKKTGYALSIYICLSVEARVAFDRGREKEGVAKLKKFFVMGREHGFVRHMLFRPAIMAEFCARALEEGIEVEHVRGLVRKCGLMPETPPLDVEKWPWPVRIFTLGRFSLVKDGEEVSFSGRAQARPLLMLKALVAFGGRGVRAAELYDRLWPDSDGDSAMSAFNTTLHRLRKLIGKDEAVELVDGLVTLNPRLVWVDTWAFERLLGEGECAIKAGHKKPGGRLIDRALRLYQGPFMAKDRDLPLYLPMADRLRSKFLRYIDKLGHLYKGAGEYDLAIERFKRGIEVDLLAEEFYLALMLCYKRLDRRAEAVNVYKRLEKNLSLMLGIKPSERSLAIYRDLMNQGSK